MAISSESYDARDPRPLVSVLVAVYNAQPYLRKCLDSLCSQTLSDIEILCTDDASTDDSLMILKAYAETDSRVKIFALPQNCGQAHARNVGLRQARGRYITFLDSDDWMDDDTLEKAVATFERHPDTGCVLFHVEMWKPNGAHAAYAMEPFEVMTGYDAFRASLTWKIHGWYMTTAELFHRFPYDESAHHFSDDNVTRFHYLYAKEVRCCPGTYHYLLLPQSVSRQVSLRRFDYLIANTSMKKSLEALRLEPEILNLYENHRWLNVVDMYMFYYVHRRALGRVDAAAALAEIRRAWATIEPRRLTVRNRFKPGYMPLLFSWFLFRLQEETYFTLRRWLKPASLLPKEMF
jgi:glycosyltransferase involved in cell wall biosynthesis